MRERTAIIIVYAIAAAIMAFNSGCNGKTVSTYVSHKSIVDPDTGREIYSRDVHTGATQELPPNAAEPTTQSVNEAGVNASTSGTHDETPEQIIAKNGRVLYVIGAVFFGLAVVGGVFLKSTPLAIGCGVAGIACILSPMLVNEVGPWLVPVAVLAAIVGGALYVSNRIASRRSSVVGGQLLAEANAAATDGKYVDAVDKMRSAAAALAVNKPTLARAAGLRPSRVK